MSWKLVAATPLDVSGVTAMGAADPGATVGGSGGASVSVPVGISNGETRALLRLLKLRPSLQRLLSKGSRTSPSA
jgi:hypothetical protein